MDNKYLVFALNAAVVLLFYFYFQWDLNEIMVLIYIRYVFKAIRTFIIQSKIKSSSNDKGSTAFILVYLLFFVGFSIFYYLMLNQIAPRSSFMGYSFPNQNPVMDQFGFLFDNYGLILWSLIVVEIINFTSLIKRIDLKKSSRSVILFKSLIHHGVLVPILILIAVIFTKIDVLGHGYFSVFGLLVVLSYELYWTIKKPYYKFKSNQQKSHKT